MSGFFKLLFKGIIVTLLSPVIVLVWALYGVYCLFLFVIMFIKSTIEFFQGKDPAGDLIEDLEARKLILEKEEADDKQKEAVNILYQNAIVQQQMQQAMFQQQMQNMQKQNPSPAVEVKPYGTNLFDAPQNPAQIEEIVEASETPTALENAATENIPQPELAQTNESEEQEQSQNSFDTPEESEVNEND